MPSLQDHIHTTLTTAFPDADITVIDTLRDQNHWKVIVTSAAFENHSPVERHRMVYAALKEDLRDTIHALSIDARVP